MSDTTFNPVARVCASKRRHVTAALAVIAAVLVTSAAATDIARADVEAGHLQIWSTSGTRVCDGFANYVAADANFQTFGAGQYKFRYTIAKDGANRFYSPMQGPWNLTGWKWYAASAWGGVLDVPPSAVLRAYLFKLQNGYWQTVAQRTVSCLF